MSEIFHTVLYQPIFNLLVFLYNIIPGNDIGIAIIVLTVIIKLILYPFSIQAIRSQKTLQTLQPKIEALKAKYKDNKEEMSKAMIQLYKKEKVNPLSSCLPLLVQLPFLWAVYRVFRDGLTNFNNDILYSFIQDPGQINAVSFGIINLSERNIVLAVLAGAAQFFQTKMLSTNRQPQVEGAKDENMLSSMNKNMRYFMPIMTVFIAMSLPSGLALYWLIATVLMIFQQYIMFRK